MPRRTRDRRYHKLLRDEARHNRVWSLLLILVLSVKAQIEGPLLRQQPNALLTTKWRSKVKMEGFLYSLNNMLNLTFESQLTVAL